VFLDWQKISKNILEKHFDIQYFDYICENWFLCQKYETLPFCLGKMFFLETEHTEQKKSRLLFN
jgi:hypothetical protein